MNFFSKIAITLSFVFLLAPQGAKAEIAKQESGLKYEIGIGSRNQTPGILLAGVSYKGLVFRAQGGGFYFGENDFWAGFRGSLLWKFFYNSPFNFDAGIGGGYEFAEAPNKMHKSINSANKAKYVRPYNYKENLDVSLEIWTHLYFLYTQVSVPAYQFKSHDAKEVLWGAGVMFSY